MDGRQTSAVEVLEEASAEFVVRWDRLVSTTNWEKGRIIHEWRTALLAAEAPPAECSDAAWSRRVGGVSGQHVGRLRRTWERFGAVHEEYHGLFWSHFQAALDWHDAEMWLEGAVQNGWSISQMRVERWETLGAIPDQVPRADDIVASELDEDFVAPGDAAAEPATGKTGQLVDSAADGAIDEQVESADAVAFDAAPASVSPAPEPFRPFEHLAPLPDDLAEACEAFKLAIVRHKLAGWTEVARDDVLASLEALKTLALAPSDG